MSMSVPTYQSSLHDFRPLFNSPIYTTHFQTEEQIDKFERKYAEKRVFKKKRFKNILSSAFI